MSLIGRNRDQKLFKEVIVIDGVNNRVGINEQEPDETLHLKTSAGTDNNLKIEVVDNVSNCYNNNSLYETSKCVRDYVESNFKINESNMYKELTFEDTGGFLRIIH